MKKFSDYVEMRDRLELATALVENDIDVDAWVGHIMDVTSVVELSESELYNELLSGLANLAGRGIGAGFNLAGRGLSAGAGAMGNAVRTGMGVAQNAARAMAPKIQGAGHALSNVYQQGEQAAKLNKAMQGIDKLEKYLLNIGADSRIIGTHLGNLRTQLQQMAVHNQKTMGARLGQGSLSLA